MDFKKMSAAEVVEYADQGMHGNGGVTEMQRRLKRSNKLLTLVNFFLGLAALILGGVQVYYAVHPPQPQRIAAPKSDPLKLFSSDDKALHDCLVKANPQDPLGILNPETPGQAAQRKVCLEQYGGH